MKERLGNSSKLFFQKYSINFIFSSVIFISINILISTEQFKRMGLSIVISVILALLISFTIIVFLIYFNDQDTIINKKRVTKHCLPKLVGLLSLLIFSLILMLPVIIGKTKFEISYDSLNYHIPAIRSLSNPPGDYFLNNEFAIFSITYPRVGESFTAVINFLLPYLTTLQAQTISILIIIIFSYFSVGRVLGYRISFLVHIFILCVPTVFTQLQTNYVDVFTVFFVLIAISNFYTARNKSSIIIGVLWLSLLGGIKFNLLLISLFCLLIFIILKQKVFTFKLVVFSIILIILPLFQLCVNNIIEFGTPTAPYSFFFFNGLNVNEYSFLINRPEIFLIDPYKDSAIMRFIHSHIINLGNLFQHYDTRLGGGGIMFVISLILFFVGLFKLFIRQFKKFNFVRILKDSKVIVAILFFTSLILTPENYWFRYILPSFGFLMFFIAISLSKEIRSMLVFSILIFICVVQLYLVRVNLVIAEGKNVNLKNILYYSYSNDYSLLDDSPVNDIEDVQFFFIESLYCQNVGNYISLLNSDVNISTKSINLNEKIIIDKKTNAFFYFIGDIDKIDTEDICKGFSNEYSCYLFDDPIEGYCDLIAVVKF